MTTFVFLYHTPHGLNVCICIGIPMEGRCSSVTDAGAVLKMVPPPPPALARNPNPGRAYVRRAFAPLVSERPRRACPRRVLRSPPPPMGPETRGVGRARARVQMCNVCISNFGGMPELLPVFALAYCRLSNATFRLLSITSTIPDNPDVVDDYFELSSKVMDTRQ